ncbi:MAG: tetratricopeptide repeat protein [Bacteroidales bacterium]|jgi:tetratricopeptide (TPR) repeat protein|nr:tetratricopeptide repeat protein [Bacteroidales bacterium]
MNLFKKMFGDKSLTLAEKEKAIKYYEQGVNEKNIDLAINLFQKAIDLNPKYAVAYLKIAKAYYTKGNFEKVEFEVKRKYFTKSLEAAQDALNIECCQDDDYQLTAHLLIQANAFFLGDFETSLKAYGNAINIDRNSRDAILMFVNVWTRIEAAANDMFEKRVKEYYISFPSEVILTIQQVINMLIKITDMYDAYSVSSKIEDLLNKLITLVDYTNKLDIARAYNNLGINKILQTKDYEQAITSFKKAVSIMPDFVVAYFNLGNAYIDIKDYKQAIASYKNVTNIDPEDAGAYYNLGNAYDDLNDFEQAIASFQKAISIKSDYAKAYHNLGRVYHKQKKIEQAIENYKIAARLGDENTQNYLKSNDIIW